jgi:hypothetical protein
VALSVAAFSTENFRNAVFKTSSVAQRVAELAASHINSGGYKT